MLRILFVAGSLPEGGAERHTLGLLATLSARGHECHVACVRPASALASELRLPSPLFGLNASGYLDLRAVGRFATYLSQLRPDAIVAANPYALMYASLARLAAKSRAKLIVTYHSTRLLNTRERLQMLAYRALFWNADCTVYLCDRQRQYWRRRGLFSRRAEIIHNGIDPAEFREQPPTWPGTLRSALGFASTDFVIGIPALLRPEKNHMQLVAAVARLRRHGIAARALMIGDGPQRPAIETHAEQLGVAGYVTITGMQADVRPYIAACDTITLCSITETFSLAMLEAMAVGRPVVLSDVGGARDMVIPGWNGLLFPVQDTDAYVNCLIRISDPESARRMGRNARRMMEQSFTSASMTDRYERLLEDLCGAQRCARSALSSTDSRVAAR